MTIAITPSEVMLVLDVLWHQSLKGIAHILLQAPLVLYGEQGTGGMGNESAEKTLLETGVTERLLKCGGQVDYGSFCCRSDVYLLPIAPHT